MNFVFLVTLRLGDKSLRNHIFGSALPLESCAPKSLDADDRVRSAVTAAQLIRGDENSASPSPR